MKRAVRRSKKQSILVSWRWLWGVVLTVELAVAVYTSPWTGLRTVRVVGAEERDKQWIERLVAPYRGKPVLEIGAAKLKQQLLHQPRVETAAISRGLDGRVTIRLAYRTPFARAIGDGWAVDIDTKGLPFRRAEGGSPYLIRLQGAEPVSLGKHSEVLTAPLAVLRQMNARGMPSKAMVTVDSHGAMCLNIDAPTPIYLGAGDRVPAKMAALHTILEREPRILGRAKYLDIKCPEAPAVAWKPRATVTDSDTKKKAPEDEPHARSNPRQ